MGRSPYAKGNCVVHGGVKVRIRQKSVGGAGRGAVLDTLTRMAVTPFRRKRRDFPLPTEGEAVNGDKTGGEAPGAGD